MGDINKLIYFDLSQSDIGARGKNIFIYIYVYMYIQMYKYMYIYMKFYICIYIFNCVYIHIHACICIYIYTYVYIHIHIRILGVKKMFEGLKYNLYDNMRELDISNCNITGIGAISVGEALPSIKVIYYWAVLLYFYLLLFIY
jgi:hypothetical protein